MTLIKAIQLAVGAIVFVTFLFLVVYVTGLFISRLRSKESPPKSFFRWLKDLYDLVCGF